MYRTNIENVINKMHQYINQNVYNKLTSLSMQCICILLGFFIATAIATIPAQTGDWGIIAAAVIVSINELISKFVYQEKVDLKKKGAFQRSY